MWHNPFEGLADTATVVAGTGLDTIGVFRFSSTRFYSFAESLAVEEADGNAESEERWALFSFPGCNDYRVYLVVKSTATTVS